MHRATLRKFNYLCQIEKQFGRNVEANTVHHIFPLEHFPEFAYAE